MQRVFVRFFVRQHFPSKLSSWLLLWLVLRGAAHLILGDAKCTPMFQNTYVFSHRYAINIQKLDSRRSANPVHPLPQFWRSRGSPSWTWPFRNAGEVGAPLLEWCFGGLYLILKEKIKCTFQLGGRWWNGVVKIVDKMGYTAQCSDSTKK